MVSKCVPNAGISLDSCLLLFLLSTTIKFGKGGSMSQVVVGPGWLNELGSWITYNSYKPITNTAWVRAWLC